MSGQTQHAPVDGAQPGEASRPTWRDRWNRFWSHPRTRAVLRHPLFPLLALTALCLIVEENYPFSDFPMYSNIAPSSHYFHLVDEQDQPLPIKSLFGVSASEFKKIYHAKLTPMAEQRSEDSGERVKASELGDVAQEAAGQLLLDQMLDRTDGRSWWRDNHPVELRLIRTDIHREGTDLVEEPRLIATRRLPRTVEGTPPADPEP